MGAGLAQHRIVGPRMVAGQIGRPPHFVSGASAGLRSVQFRGSTVADHQEFMGRDIKSRCQIEQALVKQAALAQFDVDQQVSRKAGAKRKRFLGEATTGADRTDSLSYEDASTLPASDKFGVGLVAGFRHSTK